MLVPFDALVLSLAVTAVFVGFGATLAYVDHWSRQGQAEASLKAGAPATKTRSF